MQGCMMRDVSDLETRLPKKKNDQRGICQTGRIGEK